MPTTRSRTSRKLAKNNPAKVFGERLAELRQQGGLTVEKFAELFSAKPNTVRDWLNARVLPRAEALVGIARHFGVSIDWLLGVKGAPMYPTQWRSMTDFESELSTAIVEIVRRRGGVSAALIDEFAIDGCAALNSLVDSVESEVVSMAQQRTKWISQYDTLAIAHAEVYRVARMNAALPAPTATTKSAQGRKRPDKSVKQRAQDDVRKIHDLQQGVLQALSPALMALQSAMNEARKQAIGRRKPGRELVTIPTTVALKAAETSEEMSVIRRLFEEDQEASRLIAKKFMAPQTISR
ncbi:helix-turn-helix transcriptional regulator [Gemmatimonas sp.]|uniref:helix-turn-helix domain-containing protein n=1 Tax=Gemmatimonas sp. TaxID=1962908 RepID=UPI00286DFC95|nr:helix-turn-helix transcriptional regulator [Gemmatimonas sp.]